MTTARRQAEPRIKWLRIKKIAECIVGCPVAIHGSTELPEDLKAAVDALVGERVDIAINFQHIKSADEALEAVAHELAHVVAGIPHDGDPGFRQTWRDLLARLRREYYAL